MNSYFDTAYRSATERKFFEKFVDQSKSGNSNKVIEIVREIPELHNWTIKESYRPKCDKEAEKFLIQSAQTVKHDEKIFQLTKAVFAANINNSTVFLDALMDRIRCFFAAEYFKKCLMDCQHMSSVLNEKIFPNLNERDHQILKMECLSYKIRCLKILGDTEKAKILAREGIREAKHFFQSLEQQGGEQISDEKKLEKLSPFLGVLNEKYSHSRTSDAQNDDQIAIPRVLGKQNEKLQSCSDAVALQYDQTRGRHLVATRNIKTGSVLLVDEPFAWSTDEAMLEKNCLHCHKSLKSTETVKIPCRNCQTVNYCSEECRIESWEKYHRWECTVFDYFYSMKEIQSSRLLLAYRATVMLATRNMDIEKDDKLSGDLKKYHLDNDINKKRLEVGLNKEYDPMDYSTVYSLETNSKDIDPKVNLMHALHSILLAKCFRYVSTKILPKIEIDDDEEHILASATLRHLQAINSNAYEIVENVLDKGTKVWEPKTVGGAIYATVSLTNHSCYPNVVRHSYPRGKVVVRAIRFIPKGTEILDCYGPHFLRDIKSERHNYLFKKYNFNCNCEACSKNLSLPLSDLLYKCKKCVQICEKLKNSCTKCATRVDRAKTSKIVTESVRHRLIAIQNMLDGNHMAALPILLHHAELLDKTISDYSMEAVRTQQALIQCFNSVGCTSK
ncbi:SET and MYND domain-containing protein 4 [Neodiprion lecontei]|uniref:Protein-lysine N-methyltransferase SMYD4 n=1 Tax=Neodiprion lecontei TaxID=441921 RepID=A0A6J0BNH4_NEOLC|nr:SET and MYND domain-containing protein 4 [Neodiprion lecontei]XP_046597820.1 SET and MYND domain-containing protein 4 [Neodiprion lecontei]XP_046597821.1 SET and MYND domain-containing protein 4 [Neodiprion lecontei]XP_046597822.1 SET and MYND domain-containing protein 4 [Neodiprion lecontei]XP_046597823.1 SET and MYND domain-containing protein 4 [Neodiprion lecontei]XP_046597824.1 SET and MYND domain-containing protein 4 [Neodiprion lecontei]XP_046597825.1 SET and MYND domain-containing p